MAHHPLQKPRSRANWIIQISFGIILTAIGLLIGLSIPQSLSIGASFDNQQLTLTLATKPFWSPFGKVEFWTSVNDSEWVLLSTDSSGLEGWKSTSAPPVEAVLNVRVLMTDLLGQKHETKEIFFNSAFLDQSPDPTYLHLDQAFPILIKALATGDFQTRQQVATWMKHTEKARFLPYLVEVFQFSQSEEISLALQSLSGESFVGANALREWYQWLWTQPLLWNTQFFDWKRMLLAHNIPTLQPMLSEQGRLDWRFVLWGGIPPGGIPPLNNPLTMPASEAHYLQAKDIVFGASINGQARAYPIRIMDWHELSNDLLGGEPIALSYCPLCGSAVLFNRNFNQETYIFNTSGLLYESNKLMFDEQTMSLWPNVIGTPLAGVLAAENIVLERFPLTTTTWEGWMKLHPNTDVIDPSGNNFLTYETHEAYDLYRVSRNTLVPVSQTDNRLAEKDWVFGLTVDGKNIAYPIAQLEELSVWSGQINQQNIVILADPIPGSQFGFYPATVRAFERQNFVFQKNENRILDQHGIVWALTEEALVSANNERLERIYGETTYWFAWHTFHSDTELKNLKSGE